MLQILEVQPGEDVPGVHMPKWLQQLRGVHMYSGLERDRQAYHAGWDQWTRGLTPASAHTGAADLVAVTEGRTHYSAPEEHALRPDTAHETVRDDSELLALRAQVRQFQDQKGAVVIPAVITSALVPAAAVPTAIEPTPLPVGSAAVSLPEMPRHPAVDTDQCRASPGGVDRVGSYMFDCVRYALATICLVIALTGCTRKLGSSH